MYDGAKQTVNHQIRCESNGGVNHCSNKLTELSLPDEDRGIPAEALIKGS